MKISTTTTTTTKKKKQLEISSFYTSVTKIMIICYTVPEIWFMTDVIVIFILGYTFFPFYSPDSPKNENFKKMKNSPADIINLHKCTKNQDDMLYYPWDMAHVGCNCYFSLNNICPFTLLLAQKMKISKNWQKIPGDIII